MEELAEAAYPVDGKYLSLRLEDDLLAKQDGFINGYEAAMSECAPLVEALKYYVDNNVPTLPMTEKFVKALRAFEGDE